MVDEDEAYPRGNIKLLSCAICGRNFNQDALRKHQPVCHKTTTKKRKIFDSGKQRADGSDIQYEKTKETKQVQIYGEKPEPDVRVLKNQNWREKHSELIKAIRQARDVTVAIKTGAPLPKFEPGAVPSDYVQCSFCGRNFNSSAAQRHIPFCEQQHKRQKVNSSANQRGKAKVQAPGRNQSSEAQNGYSNSNTGYYGSGGGGGGSGYGAGGGYGYGSKSGAVGGNRGTSYNNTMSGGGRKPIKYDANSYNDNEPSSKVVYALRNKSNTRNNYGQDDPILRTGRNNQNNEINSLARKRSGNNSQKSSPMNSRTASTKSVNRRSPTPPSQPRYAANAKSGMKTNGAGGGGYSRFCTDCGTQFPVEWAKFCCLCGVRRV